MTRVSGTAASGSTHPALRSTVNSLAPVTATVPPMPVHEVYSSLTAVRNGRGSSTTPGEYVQSDVVVHTTAAGASASAGVPGTTSAAATPSTRQDLAMWANVFTSGSCERPER